MAWSRASVLCCLALFAAPGAARAVTREVADVPTFTLMFGGSVLNQLTYDTYRTPYDELQTRPYNLLFSSISRQPNIDTWPGQQGGYARYVDALVGNNGAANVSNDADAIQGSMIRRESGTLSWGLSAALLAGTIDNDSASGAETFKDGNDLKAFDVRGATAFQLGNSDVFGVGLRAVMAQHDNTDGNFEPGVGGIHGVENFEQTGLAADLGFRRFVDTTSSWELRGVLGWGKSTQDTFSESLDGTGVVTDKFVTVNDDIQDLRFGVDGSYNRLRREGLGETEYRGGVSWSQRKLENSDLAFTETGGVSSPTLTLLTQDPIRTIAAYGSARGIFQAGETEMFLGARIDYAKASGSSSSDAVVTTVSEKIDDSQLSVGLTLGLRQPLFRDKLRIVVSGHGDILSSRTETTFDTGSNSTHGTQTVASYAVGLETVLANVTLDLAWLAGEEASVVPIPIGIPSGSRRTVQLDKLVLSAAVSW